MSEVDQWPYVALPLPAGADEEQSSRLTQAAADAGALGAAIEAGRLLLYLPPELGGAAGEAQAAAIRRAVEAEWLELGWGGEVPWQIESLPDAAWALAWREGFRTLTIGRRLLIRPEWERDQPPPAGAEDRVTIWLRPGQGFGTGRHETTQLALETLEQCIEELAPEAREHLHLLDFGSGSAILGLAALALGVGRVTGVEFDPVANDNARDNLELNGASARVRLVESAGLDDAPGPFGLIVCNMLPHNALPHLGELARRLEKKSGPAGARLIYSGFLTDQRIEVSSDFDAAGLRILGTRDLAEWGALIAALKPQE